MAVADVLSGAKIAHRALPHTLTASADVTGPCPAHSMRRPRVGSRPGRRRGTVRTAAFRLPPCVDLHTVGGSSTPGPAPVRSHSGHHRSGTRGRSRSARTFGSSRLAPNDVGSTSDDKNQSSVFSPTSTR